MGPDLIIRKKESRDHISGSSSFLASVRAERAHDNTLERSTVPHCKTPIHSSWRTVLVVRHRRHFAQRNGGKSGARCRSDYSSPGAHGQMASGRICVLHERNVWNACANRHALCSFESAPIFRPWRSYTCDSLCHRHEQLRGYAGKRAAPSNGWPLLSTDSQRVRNASITSDPKRAGGCAAHRPILSAH